MISSLICALVLAAIWLRLSARLPLPVRGGLAVALVVWSLLPFPVGLAGWVMSYLSHLSITSGLLAVAAIHHRLRGRYWLPVGQLRAVCVMLVGLALFFYPMSLGSSYADPYALGFGDILFSSVLLLIGLFAWMNRAYAPCVVLIAAQGAFYFNLLHSDNLWDYLIDPWLVFWATGWLVRDRLVVRRDVRAARRQAATRAGEAPGPASEPAGSRS
ncbi:hypothetical protein [Alloalcanivorax venustensis]|uniref:hypothetical protein n=1 Tax=Alloalcanivorax venustensis TaxID=172371 RepID=UPI003511944C